MLGCCIVIVTHLTCSVALPFPLELSLRLRLPSWCIKSPFPSFLRWAPSLATAPWTLPESHIKNPCLSCVADCRCISFWSFLMRKKISWLCGWFWWNKKSWFICFMLLSDTHSRSLCAYSGNFYLLTFLFCGCRCRLCGGFLSHSEGWNTSYATIWPLCNSRTVATQRNTAVLRTFDIFQCHLMQKAVHYLVGAASQLYSGLNSQNYNMPPKLFRKSYIPASGDRSNIIPEGCWCRLLFLITWELKRVFLIFFFNLLNWKYLSALLEPYPTSVWF